jgi:alkyldihydroxyacetonephosphate synthase
MTGPAKESLTLRTFTVTDQFRTELESQVGDGAVSRDPERLDAYVTDTYWLALHAQAEGEPLGRPELVVRPTSEQGVATAVRVAGEHGVPVVAWGGGSGTQGGSVPIHGGLVIDLTGLDRILDIDERSYTVTCEAGVNGDRLERELNARGLMLPHYPASSRWATVGG